MLKKVTAFLLMVIFCLGFATICFASEKCYHTASTRVPAFQRTEVSDIIYDMGCLSIYEYTYQYYNDVCDKCGEIVGIPRELIHVKLVDRQCMSRQCGV